MRNIEDSDTFCYIFHSVLAIQYCAAGDDPNEVKLRSKIRAKGDNILSANFI